MDWTNEQIKAFDTRGGSILVSASAGSGKTTVLTQRVLNLLTTEPRCDINRLLILTFTKAAAAEMHQKIKNKLQKTIGTNPEKYGYLRRQLMLLDSASICTVDAFCNNLIKENYNKLGISFDIKTAETGDTDILKKAAAEKLLEEYISEDDRELFNDIDVSKDDSTVISNIIKSYNFISSHPFPGKWMDEAYGRYDPDVPFCDTVYYDVMTADLRRRAVNAVEMIDTKLADMLKIPSQNGLVETLTADKAHVMDIIHGIDKKDYDNLVKIVSEPFMRIKTYGTYAPGLKEEIMDCRDEYKNTLSDAVKHFDFTSAEYRDDTEKLKPKVRLYLDMLRKFGEIFDEMKRERNIIDYSDMEDMTIRLLYEEKDGEYVLSDTARELQNQYDEIMVDEFQDTNEKQNAIYNALSVDGNNIFAVGDIKQSIYRFRQTNPDIFIKRKKSCTETGFPMLVNLSDNFRSSQSVCDTVNGIFEYIMSDDVGELSYGESEKLKCTVKGNEKTEVYITEKENNDSEPEMVARIIKNLVKNGITENGEHKALRYGDIAVLTRKKKKWINYIKAFKGQGIPVHVGITENYLLSRECDSMINLLRAVDNPYSDISVSSAMMSPVFCFTPDDMLKINLTGEKHLYDGMGKTDDERIKGFAELIKRYRRLSYTLSVSELIKRIMAETGFSEIFSSFYGGEARKSNLMKLMQLAKTKEKNSALNLSYFLSLCEKMKDSKNDDASTSGDPDAVKIMTIHGSKGLEFPVCILCETAESTTGGDKENIVETDGDLGICMRMRDHKRYYQYETAQSRAYKLQKQSKELSEEMRILYVALTRAKNKLIITSACKNRDKMLFNAEKAITGRPPLSITVSGKKSYIMWVLLGMLTVHPTQTPAFGRLFVRDEIPARIILYDKETDKITEETVVPSDEKVLSVLHDSAHFLYENKGLEKVPVRMSVSDIAKKSDTPEFTARPAFSEKKDSTAAERGTATHKFMQFVNYENAVVSLDGEINRLKNGFFMSEKDLSLCDIDSIKRFFQSRLFGKITSADKVMREYPFMYGIKAEKIGITDKYKDETVLVQGIADLIIIRNGRFSVIDYKTDAVDSEKILTERYREQLTLYTEALTEKLKLPPDEIIIYSFALNKEILL